MRTNIKYAVWDQTNLISNRYLRQYIRDNFNQLHIELNAFIHHDLETIIESCSYTDFLVVMQSGHTLRSAVNFKSAIKELCKNNDFLIAGQIIYHVNTYPFLHPQMFILNMNQYKECGSPMIGYYEDSDVIDLHRPVRSDENIHDDHTPLWLKPSGDIVSCVKRNFGWNIIHESLERGVTVLNITGKARWSKRFLYPNSKPHTFANCLEKLSNDELFAIPTALPQNQQDYLNELISPGTTCQINLFNTETLVTPLPSSPAKRLFGLASGFKPFVMWHKMGMSCDVIYYDYNRVALQTWKTIINEWDGKDFESFCESRGFEANLSFDDLLLVRQEVPYFEETWNEFRKTYPTFLYCDILKDPIPLINQMADDGNHIWYSNCFTFYESVRRYGMSGCQSREAKFASLVRTRDSSAVLYNSYDRTFIMNTSSE